MTRRRNPYEGERASLKTWLARLALFFLAMTSCLTVAFILYGRWLAMGGDSGTIVGSPDPNLSPAERVYLQAFLATQSTQLEEPVARGREAIKFEIVPGQTAQEVASRLSDVGLIQDTTLFINYLRFKGLDSELEAGQFEIDPQWTIPELALGLTQSYAQEIELRFLEGWRLEEMSAYLAVTTPGNIDATVFRSLVAQPDGWDRERYQFLAPRPAGTSLEGYLFPDTYRVHLDAEATDLLDLMLDNFRQRVTRSMQQAFAASGLSLHEAVTLASIVERETPLPEERPLVAGVFLNRLRQGMLLQADPTVQYAVGFDVASNNWWKSPLTQSDLEVDSPYNTYLYEGLPPGPIANPGLASLEAVAWPAQTNHLYFVADCDTDGAHLFSQTYEEHLVKVERCRQ